MIRQLIISIDGDGFIYRTAYDGRYVGEVIYEKILTRYPFRFCASFIAGENEYYADEFDLDLARKILRLENVDAASHSWSHPHDWTKPVDLEQEIVKSVHYMNKNFLPPGKTTDTFLWTGMCNPTRDALEMTSQSGLWNMNGGAKNAAFSGTPTAPHFHSRANADWVWMDMPALRAECETRGESFNVYPLLLNYPGDLGGFKGVIDYFKNQPDCPVHIFFHWYAAVRQDSLAALINVLDWCLTQDLEPVSIPHYLAGVAPEPWKADE